MPLPKLTPIRSLTGTVGLLLQLALVGVAVGLACWPLNLLDHWQDLLLHTLPAFSEQGWSPQTVATACAPVVVVPLLLFLQAKAWRGGSGSGIPQTMASIKDPAQADQLMAARPTIQRLVIWSVATLALLPMGREGPVVQVGAAVAHRLRQRWPSLVNRLSSSELMTVAAGAGLAGGFNTPLLGVIFVAEELTGNFGANLVWPGLVIGALAAEVSSLGGQAQFGLGMIRDYVFELSQLGWGLVLGVTAGLLGGLFARLLLEATAWITPRARRHPWSVGLVLGLAIAGMALLDLRMHRAGVNGRAKRQRWDLLERHPAFRAVPGIVRDDARTHRADELPRLGVGRGGGALIVMIAAAARRLGLRFRRRSATGAHGRGGWRDQARRRL